MWYKIKNRLENELNQFIRSLNKTYKLNKISPLLFNQISEFVLRDGKRVRPILFVVGYLGYAKKESPGLFSSALSLELLHDFMLVHDDIIDKSLTRRGKPSMHAMLNQYLKKHKNVKFSGEDLAIVVGDVMYALGLSAFLSIKADSEKKEKALKKLIEAALYTGSGEFIELLYGLKTIKQITKEDIYKIYDLKTACYTFATPLSMGSILGGANEKDSDRLFQYGIYLGRAFQIKDDIIGMFSDERKIGKSTLTDLEEGKKTLLIWHAYNNSNSKTKKIIKDILAKNNIKNADLNAMKEIVVSSGALAYAKEEINSLIKKSEELIADCKIQQKYKDSLQTFSREILKL